MRSQRLAFRPDGVPQALGVLWLFQRISKRDTKVLRIERRVCPSPLCLGEGASICARGASLPVQTMSHGPLESLGFSLTRRQERKGFSQLKGLFAPRLFAFERHHFALAALRLPFRRCPKGPWSAWALSGFYVNK